MNLFKKMTICLIVYLIISIVTLPFIDSIWLGEIPLLALVQLPKTTPAIYMRNYYVDSLAQKLNLSRGSASPDYAAARPYALMIVYVIPLLVLFLCYILFLKNKKGAGKYFLILLFFSVIDYACTLYFSHSSGGLTIY